MSKWWIGIVASLSLASCGSTQNAEKDYVELIFEDVCSRTMYVCEDFEAPTLVITSLLSMMEGEIAGFYVKGEKYLFINPNQTVDEALESMYHEMVHYVQWNNGITDRCFAEEDARRITAGILGLEYSDDWKEWYECPIDT